MNFKSICDGCGAEKDGLNPEGWSTIDKVSGEVPFMATKTLLLCVDCTTKVPGG